VKFKLLRERVDQQSTSTGVINWYCKDYVNGLSWDVLTPTSFPHTQMAHIEKLTGLKVANKQFNRLVILWCLGGF
jgi:hypothetical protein